MNQRQIITMAREGRPDLAAINAGLIGRPRLAAYAPIFLWVIVLLVLFADSISRTLTTFILH